MEERVVIACPHCSAQFKVRRENLGRMARCGKCKKTFPLTVPAMFDEDDILSWVGKKDHDDEADIPNATFAGVNVIEEINASSLHLKIPFKLQHIDGKGVHFRLTREMLKTEKFRSSFPRACAGCLDKRNLRVFLVRWPVKGNFPAGYGDVNSLRPVATLNELPRVSPVELLQYLPVDKNLPEPYGLPFPFFVCGRCKPNGLVYSPLSVEEKDETCVLTVFNPELAFEFYAVHCGQDTADYQKLLAHSGLCKTSRWEALPEPDRKRISQWYKPTTDEHFVCYVPDLDNPRDRKGQTGIVLTSQRLVCGKDPLLRQFPFQEHVTLSCHSVPEGRKVDISSSTQSRISFRLCDSAWVDLKHSLHDLKVNARLVEV